MAHWLPCSKVGRGVLAEVSLPLASSAATAPAEVMLSARSTPRGSASVPTPGSNHHRAGAGLADGEQRETAARWAVPLEGTGGEPTAWGTTAVHLELRTSRVPEAGAPGPWDVLSYED